MRVSAVLQASAIAAAALAHSSALGQEYFAQKSITLIVGGAAGAGYDLYGRAIGRYFGRHVPGNPNVVVQNMPGAGSINLANHMYSRASRDGLTLAMPFTGALVSPLLDASMNAAFKPAEFIYLGSANVSNRVCATFQTSGTKTFKDALVRGTLMGGDAPGGSPFDYAVLLRNEVGAQFKVIRGYKGTSDIMLAMERGEVEGLCGIDWSSLRSQRPHWVKDKPMNVLLQVGFEKHEELPNVPTIWEFVKTEESRAVLELIMSQQVFGRPVLLPPGVPNDRVSVLRKAFDATTLDADFRAQIEKLGLEVRPAPGQRAQTVVEKMYSAPPEIVKRARQALLP